MRPLDQDDLTHVALWMTKVGLHDAEVADLYECCKFLLYRLHGLFLVRKPGARRAQLLLTGRDRPATGAGPCTSSAGQHGHRTAPIDFQSHARSLDTR